MSQLEYGCAGVTLIGDLATKREKDRKRERERLQQKARGQARTAKVQAGRAALKALPLKEAELKAVVSRNSDLEARIVELEKLISTKDGRVETLEGETATIKTRLATIANKYNVERERTAELETLTRRQSKEINYMELYKCPKVDDRQVELVGALRDEMKVLKRQEAATKEKCVE